MSIRLKSPKTFRARVFWSFIPIVLLLFASIAVLTVRQQTSLVEGEFVKRGLEMARTLAHAAEFRKSRYASALHLAADD